MTTASSSGADAPIRVLGLSGSLRKGSFNTALLNAAVELAPEGMKVEPFDLSEIPMYNDDVRVAGYPESVAALRAAMTEADAIIMSSPEYNRSVPALLKNAIDWASRPPSQPFDGKPVAIMGASRGALGAAFANHHLRQILVVLNGVVLAGPEVMVGGSADKFDEAGRLIHEPTREFLAAHLKRLAALVRTHRAHVPG
ncbi:NADPH-dependent FMN reductase [Acuticoccus kandeliae]|uniref:NADPH-dependent FMN reductase n=1 Tax=Acuticoccus kandeliae TaxID=2073160 RepID=UPI000D3E52A0|nr:NAD(P)H-dependent oxidoreductase [Acuticoccus kandeliae]